MAVENGNRDRETVVVNERDNKGMGAGAIMGLLLVIFLIILLFVFNPFGGGDSGGNGGTDVEVNTPGTQSQQ